MTRQDGAGGKELSPRALALGVVLSIVLGVANAYFGLFAGMTVSAAIPAAVLSMAILRAVGGTLLENNLVQTAASAGETVAAGAIFTLPAFVLIGAPERLTLPDTTVLVLIGGVWGVLFTIPLRRVLIVGGGLSLGPGAPRSPATDLSEKTSALTFPEGKATAEVLTAGHGAGGASAARPLFVGAALGGVGKLLEGAFGFVAGTVEAAGQLGGRVFYAGAATSPALLAVGYIVGFDVAWLMLFGGLVNWFGVIPFIADASLPDAASAAHAAWSTRARFVGVGAMAVGGLYALFDVRAALLLAIRAGARALGKRSSESFGPALPETEVDLSARALGALLVVSLAALFVVLVRLGLGVPLALFSTLLAFVFGFSFSAVGAYMAGLVGSSNNPVSGVTIATVLATALCLVGTGALGFGPSTDTGVSVTLTLGVVICTAAAIGGDTMQDLSAGYLLGASPRKQQIAQLAGVACAAVFMAPVIALLAESDGFGPATALHPKPLRAPQATLIASVTEGVFHGNLPQLFVGIGALFAVLVIFADRVLRARGASFRAPVLAVAIGVYLPLELSMAVAFGGAIAFVSRGRRGLGGGDARLLGAAGLITGEALVGVVIAALGTWSLLPNVAAPLPPILGGAILIISGALFLLRIRASQTSAPAAPRD